MRSKALLFGLNYASDPEMRLAGCINDVQMMSAYLTKEFGIPCEVYTDDLHPVETSAQGIMNKLYQIAIESQRNNLDFVWIHYSGHGSSILDRSRDEKDGRDECLVPSDVRSSGVIPDDYIEQIFRYFSPKTRVVAVFDCCHSATIGDVKYSWESPSLVSVENILCRATAKIITLSGCKDDQTSSDAFNVLGDGKPIGALTACLLLALRENKTRMCSNVFALLQTVRTKLRERRFSQLPKLCSTHSMVKDVVFVPL